jgi:hypothetical protein
MIDFSKYIDRYIVLMTNSFSHPEDLPGIRNKESRIFKYGGTYVMVRPFTKDDLKDDDFIQWMSSMWKHNEVNITNFLKNSKHYESKIKPKTSPNGDV